MKRSLHSGEVGSNASSQHRQEGNRWFKSAQTDVAPVLRKERLRKALCSYWKALDCSQDVADQSSALKNVGATYLRLSDLQTDAQTRFHYIQEGCKHLAEALCVGSSVKGVEWTAACLQQTTEALHDAVDFISKAFKTSREVLGALQKVNNVLPGGCAQLKAVWCYEHAQLLLHMCLREVNKGQDHADMAACIHLLREAQRPAEEARMHAVGCQADQPGLLEQALYLQEDLQLQTCMCESIKMRRRADERLQQMLDEEEQMDMEVVWEVYDMYKEGVVATREKDLECEAICLSRLGKLLYRVLKIPSKAGEYCQRVLNLAEALKPKNVFGEQWYQEAFEIVRQLQIERAAREEDEYIKRRQPILEELESELKALRTAANADSGVTLLKHIYKEHPPRNAAHKLSAEPTFDNRKELLKQAIAHYHPDKQHAAKHEEKWCTLCEEITKELNCAWSRLK